MALVPRALVGVGVGDAGIAAQAFAPSALERLQILRAEIAAVTLVAQRLIDLIRKAPEDALPHLLDFGRRKLGGKFHHQFGLGILHLERRVEFDIHDGAAKRKAGRGIEGKIERLIDPAERGALIDGRNSTGLLRSPRGICNSSTVIALILG